jgi:choline-sulfatase
MSGRSAGSRQRTTEPRAGSLWLMLALGMLQLGACSPKPAAPTSRAAVRPRNLVLVTIDTMRADHVGAYGYAAAQTPVMDRLARGGARFDHAYATAPITLTSHASLLTGLYPPGHGARDNGVAVRADVPTLADSLRQQGFATGAFVAAFPLDRRFGLARGFDVYGDRMPRGPDGRLANERSADAVVSEAIEWLRHFGGAGVLGRRSPSGDGGPPAVGGAGVSPAKRFFLWVHLFEPHAPYGDPVRDRSVPAVRRYDAEIATADRAVGRLLDALGPDAVQSLVVVASDHGEAFGEHGEIGHSIFVYDTTLRVALIVNGPGVPPDRVVSEPVALIDVVPTVTRLLGTRPIDADGIDLAPGLAGRPLPARALYAESFAPLLDFGWSSLRSIREGRWKAIAAPRPELYDVAADPSEFADLAPGGQNGVSRKRAASAHTEGGPPELTSKIDAISGPELPAQPRAAGEAAARFGSLGYVQGGRSGRVTARPDPKDRRDLAARIAAITSGEVQGDAARTAIEAVLRHDPRNGQMQMRLGDEWLRSGRPAEAAPHFEAAIDAGLPSADPYLGLAACHAAAGRVADAIAALQRSRNVETGNPVVLANLGALQAETGRLDAAVSSLREALAIDPDFHEARFNLSRVLARAGRRQEALAEATTLLHRLPAGASERSEVERLVGALR